MCRPLASAALLLALRFLCLPHPEAVAATIVVPADVPTIGAAVERAAPLDTVLVRAGTYTEYRIRVDKSLYIFGDTSGERPVVNGNVFEYPRPDTTSVFIVTDGRIRLENLTVAHGNDTGRHAQGGAVRLLAGELVMRDCTFTRNFVYLEGGAIYGAPQTSMHVARCLFENNEGHPGGSILIDRGRLTCRDSRFDGGQGGNGGAIGAHESVVSIVRCTFRANRAGQEFSDGFAGGAIALWDSEYTIEECVFDGNTAHDPWQGVGSGGAAYVSGGAGEFVRCLFTGNEAVTRGGALTFHRASAAHVVSSCTFFENRSATAIGPVLGGHVNVYGGSPVFERNIFASARDGPGVRCEAGGTPTLRCNDLWNSAMPDLEGCGQLPAGTNFSADPRFCDPQAGDFHLQTNSPCAPEGSPSDCGLVGAFGVACAPHAIAPSTWGQIKVRYGPQR